MSRIIALFVLAAALTLLPNPGAPSSAASTSNDEMEVQIHFSGLMVFHFNQKTQAYEVGVLSADASHSHEFCVQRKGASPLCRENLPKGKRWTLAVVPAPESASAAPPATDLLMKVGRKGRHPDDEAAQFDFDWIVDLESKEFHNKRLELQPGHLVPIIQLPKARLFTAYKSEDFVRWKGKKPANPEPFGYVSETTAMTLRIKAGEKVVLSEDGGQEILTVDYAPPKPVGRSDDTITIANVRRDVNDASSDFHMYYKLFKGVPANEQYDFDLNPGQKRGRAKNPLPGYKTCCHLRCTSIFLSQWDKPLE